MKDNHLAIKRNLSSIQVLKTFQVLLEDDYTMFELIEKLNENEKEPIFNNSVISKYINTCRYCGIEIPKIYNKYFVTEIPFGISVSEREYELLQSLLRIANEIFSSKSYNIFTKFFNRIGRFTKRQILRIDGEIVDSTKESFEKAIKYKNKIRLMFKIRNMIDCVPLEIVNYKGKQCFKVFYKNKERIIATERLSGIQVLPEQYNLLDRDKSVIFKLKGELSKRYSLRANEEIVESREGEYITILNKGENSEILISRLLRYDTLCEIIKPESLREEMADTIKDMLKNYGV